MAYEGATEEGNKVNAKLYDQYQQWVIDQQSQGMPAMTYDQWIKQQLMENQNEVNRYY